MDEATFERIFDGIEGFDWDEAKSKANLLKHEIDFDDAIEIFYDRPVFIRSDRYDEERWIAIGQLYGRLIAVVFTQREKELRVISARRARKNEERTYRQRSWGDRRRGKTDFAALDALTDSDIEAAVRADPDAAPLDIDWSTAVVMPSKKKAISIRVDEDVLEFFKHEGDGYQRRINAVLRTYMQHQRKPKKRA